MHSSLAAIVLAAVAAPAVASPLSSRGQFCNVAPTASASNPPLSSPSAATAEECGKHCNAATNCLAFVFGLPPTAAAPICELFSCAASLVPPQGSELHVFDKACTGVPTMAPTHDNPQGLLGPNHMVRRQSSQGQSGGQGQGGASASNPPTSTPTSATPTSGSPSSSSDEQCGGTPTGPFSDPPAPFQTPANIASVDACLAACKADTSCKSCEFGSTTPDGDKVCLFFAVPAAQLPPPSTGQTLVAYDSGC